MTWFFYSQLLCAFTFEKLYLRITEKFCGSKLHADQWFCCIHRCWWLKNCPLSRGVCYSEVYVMDVLLYIFLLHVFSAMQKTCNKITYTKEMKWSVTNSSILETYFTSQIINTRLYSFLWFNKIFNNWWINRTNIWGLKYAMHSVKI